MMSGGTVLVASSTDTMKTRITAGFLIVLALAVACKDEEQKLAPIAGKWRGTLAEISIQPFGIPVPISRKDETFDTEIEFRTDGTIVIYDGSQPTEGTWQLNGDQLTTDVDFNTDFLELSGTYTVEILTQTTLVFYLEKENQTVTDPDTGQSISGDIRGTLHFEKI